MAKKTKNSKKQKNTDEEKIKKLEDEIKKLKKEIDEKQDKILRTMADFQNYQRRMEKDKKIFENQVKEKYVSELIDLNEILKKAYEDKKPKECIKLLLSNIYNFFERENIKPIKCKGEKFDHNLHHAITTVEKNDCEDGIIIEEVKQGYKINDKVIRPSQVIVVKNNDDKNIEE